MNIGEAIKGIFKGKKVKHKSTQAEKLSQGLVLVAEGLMHDSTGAERFRWVASILASLVDIPVIDEKSETDLIAVAIEEAGSVLGLW